MKSLLAGRTVAILAYKKIFYYVMCSLLKGVSYPSPKFLLNEVKLEKLSTQKAKIITDKGDFNSKISSEKAYNID